MAVDTRRADTPVSRNGIVRTGKGLTIAGTRIMLYDVLDHAHQGWPPERVAEWLSLTPEEIDAALAYIAAHRTEVEDEYQRVSEEAREERAYWETRNRDRFARIQPRPLSPERAAIAETIRRYREQQEQWSCSLPTTTSRGRHAFCSRRWARTDGSTRFPWNS